MASRYVIGDTVTLGNTFKVSGTATDPTTVSLAVTDPTGTTTTYTYAGSTITKVSPGVYSKNITATAAGTWRFTWTGTGSAADVQDSSFTVITPADAHDYCSLEELKNSLRIDATDTTDDLDLAISISAASEQINDHCGWRFWKDPTPTIQTYYPTSPYDLDLMDDDNGDGIATTTGLVVKCDTNDDGVFETTLTIGTDFFLLPQNAANQTPAEPYTMIRLRTTGTTTYFYRSIYRQPTIQVTAHFGWPEVPSKVKKACLAQAAQLFKTKDAVFGAITLGEVGTMRVKDRLNSTAAALLVGVRKPSLG